MLRRGNGPLAVWLCLDDETAVHASFVVVCSEGAINVYSKVFAKVRSDEDSLALPFFESENLLFLHVARCADKFVGECLGGEVFALVVPQAVMIKGREKGRTNG